MPSVILVHGYSVQNLSTYGSLPSRLAASGYNAVDIYLSAYDSLNDYITCDDLANALEIRITSLTHPQAPAQPRLQLNDTAIIAHSTGAIIVRRWMLNRFAKGLPLPSHFISLAGANHGSTLAQLGEAQFAYLLRGIVDHSSIGLEVLQDLDYGSAFLLKLNDAWLTAYSQPNPPGTLCFSLIGDDHSAFSNQIFWQSHESGSDCTVRISGGNLNYRFLEFDLTAQPPAPQVRTLPQRVPHLVLNGISHTGNNGILGGNDAAMGIVFPHIQTALQTTAATYADVESRWRQATAAWSTQFPAECNSTILFSLFHPGGRNVQDSLILIKDNALLDEDPSQDTQAILNVSGSIQPHQPIKNNVVASSLSFYVNYQAFLASYPHRVDISVNSGCPEVVYPDASYLVSEDSIAAILPNEFLYAKITLNREALGTFSLVDSTTAPAANANWPPMPASLA